MASSTFRWVLAGIFLATPSLSSHAAGQPATDCTLGPLPRNATVTVVGVYWAWPPSDVKTGSSGFDTVEVTLAGSDRPTVLVLTAHESVEWRLTGPGMPSVAGVFATGLGTAIVTGVSS